MHSITLLDIIVVVVYLLGTTAIGVYAAKRVSSSASFFISDRKFGKIIMIFFGFGSGSSADQAVSVAAAEGATVQLVVSIGLLLRGSAVIITAVSGGEIDCDLAMLAMTVLFVVYGVAGGLSAAILTDVVQGTLTIVLSFLILPVALSMVNGLTGLRERIADPAMFEIVSPGEINAFFIVVITINALVGWISAPTSASVGAGKTEVESRVGQVGGSMIKRICTIAWTLTGLCGVAIYSDRNIDVEQVYGLLAHDLLPSIAPGLLGLFVAATFASVMAACDLSMITASGLLVQNIYRPLIVVGAEDRHYTYAGRVASVLIVAGSLVFAYSMQSVVSGLEIFWKVSAMMGVAMWVGIFWRRATVAGAWAGTLAGVFVWLFTERVSLGFYTWDFNAVLAHRLPDFMLWDGKLYLPWQMILYLSASLIVLVAVSLLTRPVDKARLDRIYICLRTPIASNEPEPTPCTLPDGVAPAPRRVLLNHPDFEIPVPSTTSIMGFIIVSVLIALLILAMMWILSF